MDSATSLELSETEMRQLVEAAMDRLIPQIRTLQAQPVDLSGQADKAFVRSFREPLPEEATDLDRLLNLLFEEATPHSLNPISPGFMGYVPGGGLFHAAVADLIADTLNRYVGVAAVAPALSQLEASVVRWFCDIVGYPESARGFLTSGGSLATLTALITARSMKLGEDFSRGTLYVSDQIHHCIDKAAHLAGFPRRNVRHLPSDEAYRLDPEAVRQAIQQDRERGLTPFLIAASAGTTNTGAVDPLTELGEVARQENCWFHIDAAYGGFFCLTDRGKQTLHGIEQADSLVLDPHKTLFLPYGTGALLVRDGHNLRATHHATADYMPSLQDDEALVDFCALSPELTRPFRGLRVWLPLKLHGAGVFRAYLNEKLDLARWIQDQISNIPALEILAPAELSILAFAVKDTGQPLDERNAHTQKLLALINHKNRVHLTGTMLKGIYAIRIAVSSYRTHLDRMEMLRDDLNAALAELSVSG